MSDWTIEKIKEWLVPVVDPDLKMPLVDLGLIYEGRIAEGQAIIKMTLTSPACPVGPQIMSDGKKRMQEIEVVEHCEVELVWEPKWDPATMASDEVKDAMGIW